MVVDTLISCQELRKKFPLNVRIPYFTLLATKEWFEKRELIIKRDNKICQHCNNQETLFENGVNFWFKYTQDVKRIIQFQEELVRDTKRFNELPIDEQNKIKSNKLFSLHNFDLLYDIVEADKAYSLHVHHKYYVLSKLPWEYQDDALITLCNWCHWKEHHNNAIPVFKNEYDKQKIHYTPCERCSGAGFFPQFKHVQDGICFNCGGERFNELIINKSM